MLTPEEIRALLRPRRINVVLPLKELAWVEEQARAQGITRSEFIRQLIQQAMGEK